VFAQADYDGLELRTLAQACYTAYGVSKLREALNKGRDVHLALAATILKISYDNAWERRKYAEVSSARKLAKVANFGFPGGLGVKGMRVYAARKPYYTQLTQEEVEKLRADWLATWPEMRKHFRWASDGDRAQTTVTQLFSGRRRGGTAYTDRANTIFQGLGADATKRALWLLTRACHTQRDHILFGCRPAMYVHDEFLLEVPDDDLAHDRAQALKALMIEGANEFLPDCPATTEPLLMAFWSKEAQPLYDKHGRLQVWRGKT
jgi:DNA polymerase-1